MSLVGRTGLPPGPYEFTVYEYVVDLRSLGKIESCKRIEPKLRAREEE